MPVEVRSMEGLGVTVERPRKRVILGFCTGFFFSSVNSVPHGQVLEQWSLLACSSEPLLRIAARQLAGRVARLSLGVQLFRSAWLCK